MENLKNPTPVVGEVDNTIQWINLSPVDSTVHFVSTDVHESNNIYLLDSIIHPLNNWALANKIPTSTV